MTCRISQSEVMNHQKRGSPAENEAVGQSVISTSATVSKYSMIVNGIVKNVHGASLSRIYGTQSDRLVEEGSFLSTNAVGDKGRMI